MDTRKIKTQFSRSREKPMAMQSWPCKATPAFYITCPACLCKGSAWAAPWLSCSLCLHWRLLLALFPNSQADLSFHSPGPKLILVGRGWAIPFPHQFCNLEGIWAVWANMHLQVFSLWTLPWMPFFLLFSHLLHKLRFPPSLGVFSNCR